MANFISVKFSGTDFKNVEINDRENITNQVLAKNPFTFKNNDISDVITKVDISDIKFTGTKTESDKDNNTVSGEDLVGGKSRRKRRKSHGGKRKSMKNCSSRKSLRSRK
jgi:hypothetical protein